MAKSFLPGTADCCGPHNPCRRRGFSRFRRFPGCAPVRCKAQAEPDFLFLRKSRQKAFYLVPLTAVGLTNPCRRRGFSRFRRLPGCAPVRCKAQAEPDFPLFREKAWQKAFYLVPLTAAGLTNPCRRRGLNCFRRLPGCAPVRCKVQAEPDVLFLRKSLAKSFSPGTADCCGPHKPLPAARFQLLWEAPGLRPGESKVLCSLIHLLFRCIMLRTPKSSIKDKISASASRRGGDFWFYRAFAGA